MRYVPAVRFRVPYAATLSFALQPRMLPGIRLERHNLIKSAFSIELNEKLTSKCFNLIVIGASKTYKCKTCFEIIHIVTVDTNP